MIYPKFLKPGDTIGICAPSAGIDKEDERFDKAIKHLKDEGYNVYETANVRTGVNPSSDAQTRANEFNELMRRDDIDFIYSAEGGDFLYEMVPLVDEEAIKASIASGHTKFVAGYSDPTTLLHYLTTKFDIATLYGTNAGSYKQTVLYKNLQDALKIIKGDIVVQDSFAKHERLTFEEYDTLKPDGYVLNRDTKWINLNQEAIDIKGRIIGGCTDCLKYMVGTELDYTKEFIEKYKDDGIIWALDTFALSSDDLCNTLWQMKKAGWFKYAKGFIFGRIIIMHEREDFSYADAVKRALGDDIPIIMEADLGHVRPSFNIILGSVAHIISKDGKGSLSMELS